MEKLPGMTSWIIGLLLVSFNINVICSMSLRASKRQNADNYIEESGRQLDCIQMESFPGDYWYAAPSLGVSHAVCGLFLVGSPGDLFEVEFTEFDISCEAGGLLATLDGWETQGQIFPGKDDHELSLQERYRTYCGENAPSGTFVTSQNVGLIQFRIPRPGDGFRISVRLLQNTQPCNVMSMDPSGVYTVTNWGQRRNCSVSFLYPESISVLSLNVGETSAGLGELAGQTGGIVMCAQRGREDRLELLGGEGLDPEFMAMDLDLCGLDTLSGDLPEIHVACSHTVVRLVSGGRYYNSVTFMHNPFVDLNLPDKIVFRKCF